MKVAVVGSGAIGSYYGAKLAAAGFDLHFLLRSDFDAVNRNGIRILSKSGDLHLPRINCYKSTNDIGPADLVLIALKTTANRELEWLIPPLLHQGTILLTLQNGLGNDDFLAERFEGRRVVGGLCFVCLIRTSPGVVEHYDRGHLSLGEFSGGLQDRTHAIVKVFERGGIDCHGVENLGLERWRKLVWNIPFNGISVRAGGADTAAIMADPVLRSEVKTLMEEVIDAAGRCGYNLPSSTVGEQMRRTEEMGAYKPSTLIDYEAGKPLEIEAIWGEPLRRAAATGAATPLLSTLYFDLQKLDAGNRKRNEPSLIRS